MMKRISKQTYSGWCWRGRLRPANLLGPADEQKSAGNGAGV